MAMNGVMEKYEKHILPQFPQAGELLTDNAKFAGNAGGNADPDSLRGFGATEQYWNIPTSDGWTFSYADNGGGFVGATAPDGTRYMRGIGESQMKPVEYYQAQ